MPRLEMMNPSPSTSTVGGLDWLFDRDVELGQILHGQPAALLARKADHPLGDVAAIEAVTGCTDTGFAGRGPALSLYQHAQRAGKVLLYHPCAERNRMPIRQEDAVGRGPLPHPLQRARSGQDVQHQVVHGEAVVCQFDGRRRYVSKRHRAVTLERHQPGING